MLRPTAAIGAEGPYPPYVLVVASKVPKGTSGLQTTRLVRLLHVELIVVRGVLVDAEFHELVELLVEPIAVVLLLRDLRGHPVS